MNTEQTSKNIFMQNKRHQQIVPKLLDGAVP